VVSNVTIAGIVAVFAAITLFLNFRDRRVTTIYFVVDAVTPLMRRYSGAAKIDVRYNEESLPEPHLVRLRVSVKSRHSISRDRFDDDRPFRLVFDAKVIEILSARHLPFGASDPAVKRINDSSIGIGPGLLHRRYSCEIEVLTSGAPTKIVPSSSVADAEVLPLPTPDQIRRLDLVKKVPVWAAVAFIIFFIAYRPETAAETAKQIGHFVANLFG